MVLLNVSVSPRNALPASGKDSWQLQRWHWQTDSSKWPGLHPPAFLSREYRAVYISHVEGLAIKEPDTYVIASSLRVSKPF